MDALESAGLLRLIFFFGILLIMCILEVWVPFRKLRFSKPYRWSTNLGIVALNTIFVKLVFPVTAIAFASFVQKQGWGLLSLWEGPRLIELAAAVILLDMGIYWQHVAFHYVPFLWRLHRMHHADTDFDVTTGARFHPIEILLSMLIKFWMILALGPSPMAVLIFEIMLNGTAMFNHSNISLPKPVDTFVRWFLVTPDMHRIHHSVVVKETNSNYGFSLPWWDRMFGSYTAEPAADPRTMPIGLEEFREKKDARIDQLLLQPFQKR